MRRCLSEVRVPHPELSAMKPFSFLFCEMTFITIVFCVDVKLSVENTGQWVGQINALLINPTGLNRDWFYFIHFIHYFITFLIRIRPFECHHLLPICVITCCALLSSISNVCVYLFVVNTGLFFLIQNKINNYQVHNLNAPSLAFFLKLGFLF